MDIDDLIEALDEYNRRREELQKCIDSCEYDASYYCSRDYLRRDIARAELAGKLDAYIDARIEAKLGERNA